MREQKGFTLLEVLITSAVLALIALIAVPAFSAFSDKMLLQQEASVLTSELRYMRELSMGHPQTNADFPAVTAGTLPTFHISQDQNEYSVVYNKKFYERHKMPEGMRLIADVKRLSFSSKGDANPLSLLLDYKGKRKWVIVDIVGRIRVSDTPVEG